SPCAGDGRPAPAAGGVVRADGPDHPTAVPLPDRRCAVDQLPPAALEPAAADVGVRRVAGLARRVSGGGAAAVSLLQLRRCDADRMIAEACRRPECHGGRPSRPTKQRPDSLTGLPTPSLTGLLLAPAARHPPPAETPAPAHNTAVAPAPT